MKNLDFFTKRLFSITICCCAILLCSGLFMFSVKPVNAKQNQVVHMPQTNVAGKYMMQFITWQFQNDDYNKTVSTVRQILVWDTETGNSKRYALNDNDQWVPTETQLPEKPL